MKKFKVISPYSLLNTGDMVEQTEDGKGYVSSHSEEYTGDGYYSSFNSTVKLSNDCVDDLIEQGFLQEVPAIDSKFVNVFDEIDNLLKTYTNELAEVDKDKDNVPMCLKVEKTTVLENLIKVLTHLKNLKK